jgi:hypothetical protein
MAWWRRAAEAVERIEISEADLRPEPMDTLAISKVQISRHLDILRGDEIRIEAEIAERTETLRQTRVRLEAFSAAEAIIDAGVRPKDKLPPPDDDPSERLVPRPLLKSRGSRSSKPTPIAMKHEDIRS